MSENTRTKELDTENAHFQIENGVLITTFKSKRITLEIAKEIVRDRKKFTAGRAYPGLGWFTQLKVADKQARDYFSTDEANEGVTAGALIADSLFISLLVNFFLKVSGPKVPARVFRNTEDAMMWLEQFRN